MFRPPVVTTTDVNRSQMLTAQKVKKQSALSHRLHPVTSRTFKHQDVYLLLKLQTEGLRM